jgi:hypothetical protein
MKHIAYLLIVLSLSCGCMVKHSISVRNNAGCNIVASSVHGGSIAIKNGKTGLLPHGVGRVDIGTDCGDNWHYTNICVYENTNTVHKGVFILDVRLNTLIDTNGYIYIIPKRRGARMEYRLHQPPNYPQQPVKMGK